MNSPLHTRSFFQALSVVTTSDSYGEGRGVVILDTGTKVGHYHSTPILDIAAQKIRKSFLELTYFPTLHAAGILALKHLHHHTLVRKPETQLGIILCEGNAFFFINHLTIRLFARNYTWTGMNAVVNLTLMSGHCSCPSPLELVGDRIRVTGKPLNWIKNPTDANTVAWRK